MHTIFEKKKKNHNHKNYCWENVTNITSKNVQFPSNNFAVFQYVLWPLNGIDNDMFICFKLNASMTIGKRETMKLSMKSYRWYSIFSMCCHWLECSLVFSPFLILLPHLCLCVCNSHSFSFVFYDLLLVFFVNVFYTCLVYTRAVNWKAIRCRCVPHFFLLLVVKHVLLQWSCSIVPW